MLFCCVSPCGLKGTSLVYDWIALPSMTSFHIRLICDKINEGYYEIEVLRKSHLGTLAAVLDT